MVYVISGFSCMIGYALLRTLPEGDKIIALVKPGEKIFDFVKKSKNIIMHIVILLFYIEQTIYLEI